MGKHSKGKAGSMRGAEARKAHEDARAANDAAEKQRIARQRARQERITQNARITAANAAQRARSA